MYDYINSSVAVIYRGTLWRYLSVENKRHSGPCARVFHRTAPSRAADAICPVRNGSSQLVGSGGQPTQSALRFQWRNCALRTSSALQCVSRPRERQRGGGERIKRTKELVLERGTDMFDRLVYKRTHAKMLATYSCTHDDRN